MGRLGRRTYFQRSFLRGNGKLNMEKGNLGFGWMRLPLKSSDSKDIDLEQVSQMVDEYMAAGYNYFETS